MMGADEEDKIFISSHIEDEAPAHGLLRPVLPRGEIGIKGESIMDVLDASYEYRMIHRLRGRDPTPAVLRRRRAC